MRDYFRYGNKIRFDFPLDGDCLNIYDGALKDGELFVKVKVQADKDSEIEINQIPAVYNGEFFEANVPVYGYRTNLVAKDDKGNEERIVVYRLINPVGIFRLSSDDNILFLQDINNNKDTYKSIFENPYLAMYKEAHDKYGATVQLNIHWEYEPDNECFSAHNEYFNLSMMTDKFKDEFIKNSDWLKLSFHAREPQTVMPYLNTDMKTISYDAERIYKETVRFAGEETLLRHNTTIHWGECTLEGMRAMSNLGLRGAFGYFDIDENGRPLVSYFYPKAWVEHIHERDFWMDTEEDILYGKIDLVLNLYPLEEIVPRLEKIKENKNISGCVEIMIHEQYFYNDYFNHIPAFKEIVWSACKWCADNGYKGYFLKDVMEK